MALMAGNCFIALYFVRVCPQNSIKDVVGEVVLAHDIIQSLYIHRK